MKRGAIFVLLILISITIGFASAAEPQPPANAILIQNFNPGDLANGSYYLSEPFDRYSDNGNDITLMDSGNTNYGAYNGGPAKTAYVREPGRYILITGRNGSGLALRTNYSAAGQEPAWVTPYINGNIGSYAGALVMQFWFRLPDADNFTDSSGWKFFEMWYANGSHGRIQYGVHGVFHFNPGYAPNDHSRSGAEIGAEPVGPYPTQSSSGYPNGINDGQWHRMTIEYKTNTVAATGWNAGSGTYTTNSSRDGLARVWIDGIKVTDVSNATIGVTPAGGTKVWCTAEEVDTIGAGSGYNINYLQYPEYINGITGFFNVDHDDMKVWVTNNTNDTASNNTADFNADNVVNKTDILTIIYWILGIDRTNSAVDLDGNGVVNIFDLVNASKLFGKQYGTDTTQPAIILSRPANNTNLSAGTTSVVMFFETNEKARCRYLNTTGGSFATMNNFTRDGSISHSITLNVTNGTIYNYYVQCNDTAGNLNSTNYYITFGVNGSTSSDEPTYQQGVDTQYFFDGFEAFSSSADLLTWQSHYNLRWTKNAATNTSNAYLVTGYGGGQAVHFAYPGLATEEDLLLEADGMDTSTDGVSPLVVSWLMRQTPGYVYTQPGTGGDGWFGNGRKLFFLNSGLTQRMCYSIASEEPAPAFVPYGFTGPSVSYGNYAWPQNLNHGTGAGQYGIVESGSQATRTTTTYLNGVDIADHWVRHTLRLTASPTDFGNVGSPTSNARGRIEMWMTDLNQSVTVKVMDWDGNNASKQEYGYVNVPYNTNLAPLLNFPANSNCRPPQAQWMEYDNIRVFTKAA